MLQWGDHIKRNTTYGCPIHAAIPRPYGVRARKGNSYTCIMPQPDAYSKAYVILITATGNLHTIGIDIRYRTNSTAQYMRWRAPA